MEKHSDSQKKQSRKKYLITAVIIFLCILADLFYRAITWTPIDSESKKASEKFIRQAAAAQLNKDPNELTDEDFAKINEFILTGDMQLSNVNLQMIYRELTDIKMLEKFINLQTLSLSIVAFPEKDIPSWMKIMSKLGAFDLNERFSLDLSPLEKLNYLQKLNLTFSQVCDLEPIRGLVNLESLRLSGTQVSDLEVLRKLTNLKELVFASTQVSDLKPIKGLTNLELLSISNTQVSNLEPIRGLTNLTTLGIRNTQVSDLEPIRGLTNLKELGMDNTQVSDLEPIRELTNLESLYLMNTPVSNLEPIKGLTNLKRLVIINTQVSNLEPLKGLKNLQSLYIKDCAYITYEQVEELQKVLPNLKINR